MLGHIKILHALVGLGSAALAAAAAFHIQVRQPVIRANVFSGRNALFVGDATESIKRIYVD